MGVHSPGPKYVPREFSRPTTRGPKGGKDPNRPVSTFGYSRRDGGGVYMGRAFANFTSEEVAAETPRPGQYKQSKIEKTRFRTEGGNTFGRSLRPPLAKVAF